MATATKQQEQQQQLREAAAVTATANDNKLDLCQNITKESKRNDDENKQTDTKSENHDVGRRHLTRYRVVLLALAIAVVNCYAQATFCIAIVEMVLPSDFVLKPDSGQQVAVVVNGGAKPATSGADLSDSSCPVEYRYRYYYDEWRFAGVTNSSSANPNPASSNDKVIDISNRFDWDASRQGLLLGAFAVGSAPLQVLGGRLAEIYGAKWVLLASCIGTAITNLTIPFLAHFSFGLLILNRVVMGIAQAGMEPGIMCLLAKWLAPSETSYFISMQLFAICIGFFLGSLCPSFLLTLGYGWPLTYYSTGLINLLVAVVWLLYASSTPAESKLISAEELAYLQHEQRAAKVRQPEPTSALNDDLNGNWKLDISSELADALAAQNSRCKGDQTDDNGSGEAPWTNILSTRAVWAFILTKVSIRWCADVLGSEMPTYMANVLHLSIKLNGIINSLASALFALSSFLTGYLINQISKRQKLAIERGETTKAAQISKTNLRKMFQSVASFGSALSLFLMTRYDCNIILSMSMLMVLSCCLVMSTGGEMQMPYDMTAQYPGTLHGMACTLSVSGWLAPPLIGLILGDQPSSRQRWNIVWYLTAAINLLGGLVFVLFADASPRDFDRVRRPRARQPIGKQPDARGGDRGQHYGAEGHEGLSSYCNVLCNDNKPADWPQVANKMAPAWQPHFDAELIRVRQVEESFVPCRLDSVASQPIIFPFNMKHSDVFHAPPRAPDPGRSQGLLRGLLAAVAPSRKRFCLKVAGQEAARAEGLEAGSAAGAAQQLVPAASTVAGPRKGKTITHL